MQTLFFTAILYLLVLVGCSKSQSSEHKSPPLNVTTNLTNPLESRKFSCQITEGPFKQKSFEFFYQEFLGYPEGGYRNSEVIWQDGLRSRLTVKDFNTDTHYQAENIHFRLDDAGIITSSGKQITYRLYLSDYNSVTDNLPAESKGFCVDQLYSADIWPYENSKWKLVEVICENGKVLELPPGTETILKTEILGYGSSASDGHQTQYYEPMPAASVKIESFSQGCKTAYLDDVSTVTISDPRFSLTRTQMKTNTDAHKPFLLLHSYFKRPQQIPKECAPRPELLIHEGAIVDPTRISVTLIHGVRKECDPSGLMMSYGKYIRFE